MRGAVGAQRLDDRADRDDVRAAGVGGVELLEGLLGHDHPVEGLLPVEGDRVVLGGRPQAATDPDAGDLAAEHGAIDRVEDVAAVEDDGAGAGREGAEPEVVGEVVLVGLGVRGGAADEGHDVEAVGLDERGAAREGGEDRTRLGRREGAGDEGAALGVAETDAVRRHEDEGARGRAGRATAADGAERLGGGRRMAEEAQHAVRPGRGGGAACPDVGGDAGEVREDLGVEVAVEPDQAVRCRHEGVAPGGVGVAGGAVEERPARGEEVRRQHLQAVAALDPHEEDGKVGAPGEGQRQGLAVGEDREALAMR